ncbi:mitochondrial import receptor subunit tom20 [Cystobasidiomycetes sp. EMM_F5]
MVKITPQLVAGATVASLAGAGVAYAVYFDYKRRNDPAFRRQILRERRKVERASQQATAQERVAQTQRLAQAVRQIVRERLPTSLEEREAHFLEQVASGEALAARGPDFYVPATIHFFRAMQVYPNPEELMMIYSRTQPQEVVLMIVEALRLSVSGNSGPSGGAILEEIDTDSTPAGNTSGSRATARDDEEGSGPNSQASSGTGSYVDVQRPS